MGVLTTYVYVFFHTQTYGQRIAFDEAVGEETAIGIERRKAKKDLQRCQDNRDRCGCQWHNMRFVASFLCEDS